MSIFGPRLKDDVLVRIIRPKLKDDVVKDLDYFIYSRTNEASFDYYFESELNIKSVTLKNIMFYNSWWTTDIHDDDDTDLVYLKGIFRKFSGRFGIEKGHYSFSHVCSAFETMLKSKNINHVKIYCNENNHIIIELTEDKSFELNYLTDVPCDLFSTEDYSFGGRLFHLKGKYYSPKPVNFYKTDLFLRCNLVNQQNTFYNDKRSNILSHFPVDDGGQVKQQIYQPLNCTKLVNQTTNHLKLEITDENSKVINFRGNPVMIHLSFETYA